MAPWLQTWHAACGQHPPSGFFFFLRIFWASVFSGVALAVVPLASTIGCVLVREPIQGRFKGTPKARIGLCSLSFCAPFGFRQHLKTDHHAVCHESQGRIIQRETKRINHLSWEKKGETKRINIILPPPNTSSPQKWPRLIEFRGGGV